MTDSKQVIEVDDYGVETVNEVAASTLVDEKPKEVSSKLSKEVTHSNVTYTGSKERRRSEESTCCGSTRGR